MRVRQAARPPSSRRRHWQGSWTNSLTIFTSALDPLSSCLVLAAKCSCRSLTCCGVSFFCWVYRVRPRCQKASSHEAWCGKPLQSNGFERVGQLTNFHGHVQPLVAVCGCHPPRFVLEVLFRVHHAAPRGSFSSSFVALVAMIFGACSAGAHVGAGLHEALQSCRGFLASLRQHRLMDSVQRRSKDCVCFLLVGVAIVVLALIRSRLGPQLCALFHCPLQLLHWRTTGGHLEYRVGVPGVTP